MTCADCDKPAYFALTRKEHGRYVPVKVCSQHLPKAGTDREDRSLELAQMWGAKGMT